MRSHKRFSRRRTASVSADVSVREIYATLLVEGMATVKRR